MAGIQDVAVSLSQGLRISQREAREVIEAVLTTITNFTVEGESVTVRGFGTFKQKTTKARTGRNPQTGEKIQVPAKTKLTFKAAK